MWVSFHIVRHCSLVGNECINSLLKAACTLKPLKPDVEFNMVVTVISYRKFKLVFVFIRSRIRYNVHPIP